MHTSENHFLQTKSLQFEEDEVYLHDVDQDNLREDIPQLEGIHVVGIRLEEGILQVDSHLEEGNHVEEGNHPEEDNHPEEGIHVMEDNHLEEDIRDFHAHERIVRQPYQPG
ncbi:hypothetical protein Leryth_017951 [Lithospermum erythrorhizon]|nr:hypothetical protein Leryth_017951 [Lithospermum erythrorhizon]